METEARGAYAKWGIVALFVVLFSFYGFFLLHKIDLVTADLGRHIKNGEVVFEDPKILTQNFYSYTEPEFRVTNHHWGSGALFYGAWKLGGFEGTQVFFILLSFATLAVFVEAGRRYGGWTATGVGTLIVLPLLAERTEIRPEVFSYLFAGIFVLILSIAREEPERRRLLWALPAVMVLWVNTHIYFLLGPLLIGAFLLEAILLRGSWRPFAVAFAGTLAATLVNPFGYRAVTDATGIFRNFGYKLAENQPVWFMDNFSTNPNILIFKIVFAALVAALAFALYRNRRGVPLAHVFVVAGTSIMAWFAIRNFALFGLFAIPLFAVSLRSAFGAVLHDRRVLYGVGAVSIVIFAFAIAFMWPRYFPYWRVFGLGLEPGNSGSAEFIERHGIKGPIFNNYDIGGYLIFHLYPERRVFVDNRPEAYPATFFTESYIPMQENDAKWREMLSRYKFNAIVFSYRDMTPWGQAFLRSRVNDTDWVPVFVDQRVLIFVRNTKENEGLIKRFALPKEMFVFR